MACERGQATIEWVALVLLLALALGALLAFGLHFDGRSYGGFLARAVLCAVRGGCDDGRSALEHPPRRLDLRPVLALLPRLEHHLGRSDKLFKYSPPGLRLISRIVTGKWRYPGFHHDDWEDS